MGIPDPYKNVWRSSRAGAILTLHLSGHATITPDARTLIVSNLKDGVDTYSIPPRQPLRSFRHPVRCNVPLLVTTALQGDIVISGGDDGDVKIFEQRSGQLSTHLRHGNGMTF